VAEGDEDRLLEFDQQSAVQSLRDEFDALGASGIEAKSTIGSAFGEQSVELLNAVRRARPSMNRRSRTGRPIAERVVLSLRSRRTVVLFFPDGLPARFTPTGSLSSPRDTRGFFSRRRNVPRAGRGGKGTLFRRSREEKSDGVEDRARCRSAVGLGRRSTAQDQHE